MVPALAASWLRWSMASINSLGGKPERSADFTIIMNFMFASPFVLAALFVRPGAERENLALMVRRAKFREMDTSLRISGEARIHLRRLLGGNPWPTEWLPPWSSHGG